MVCLRNDRRLGVVNGTLGTSSGRRRARSGHRHRRGRAAVRRLPRGRSPRPRLRPDRPQVPGHDGRAGLRARHRVAQPRGRLRGHEQSPASRPSSSCPLGPATRDGSRPALSTAVVDAARRRRAGGWRPRGPSSWPSSSSPDRRTIADRPDRAPPRPVVRVRAPSGSDTTPTRPRDRWWAGGPGRGRGDGSTTGWRTRSSATATASTGSTGSDALGPRPIEADPRAEYEDRARRPAPLRPEPRSRSRAGRSVAWADEAKKRQQAARGPTGSAFRPTSRAVRGSASTAAVDDRASRADVVRRARVLGARRRAAALGQDLVARHPERPRRPGRRGLDLDQARRARGHRLSALGARQLLRLRPDRHDDGPAPAPIRCAGRRSSAATPSRRRSPWRTPWLPRPGPARR